MTKLPKIVAVLGPTASGKTDLGVVLAKKFNGEIISADSRQIYRQMSIGTAKPAGVWRHGKYWYGGIPHYLMDIVDVDEKYTVADFKEQAEAKINEILGRGKLPIVVGGTGLYIWALVENLDVPHVPPDTELRAELEKIPLVELAKKLRQIDPATAVKIDLRNPRRVLRALEVCLGSGSSFFEQRRRSKPLYNILQIGLRWPKEILDHRLDLRTDQMIAGGLIDEVKKLNQDFQNNKMGKSVWDLVSMTGIGYRNIGLYLRGRIDLAEAVKTFKRDSRRYARRQMTWFKRGKSTEWIAGADEKAAEKLVEKFISKF